MLKYLDLILQAHAVPPGSTKQTQPPWLFLDAAHVLFQTAKSRVYRGKIRQGGQTTEDGGSAIPSSLEPVLEEQPKWAVLADVLQEIEQDTYLHPTAKGRSNSTILVMCGDQKTCDQLREYLDTKHLHFNDTHDRADDVAHAPLDQDADEPRDSADHMLRRRLKSYLHFKQQYARVSKNLVEGRDAQNTDASSATSTVSAHGARVSGRAPPAKRRRIRGASATTAASSPGSASPVGRADAGSIQPEGDNPQEASLLKTIEADAGSAGVDVDEPIEIVDDDLHNMEDYYELYDLNDLLLIYPYSGDYDDHILEETKPQYLIVYEPDPAFIRRVEVYRSSHVGRHVRAYFMYYGGSVEEQRYLSAVRREKDAFTKLIKEKANMVLTLTHDRFKSDDPQDAFLRTVNTRIAGGGRLVATSTPPTVVVDVREFRSALPSLLHGKSVVVVPCQLTVGDYVLTPDIAIER
ncbi:hypothetical protein KEM52_000239, partial [Ascosphaera acerosa]